MNHIEHFLISISAVTGCVSISAFASLVGTPISIASLIGLQICVITGKIKKQKLPIKEKKNTHDKLVLLGI